MRAFLRTSSGKANEPASRVAQPAESSAPSSVEQPAETFASIGALNRWLESQSEPPSGTSIQRLRAAVAVLTKKPKPRHHEIAPFCSSWKVCQFNQKQRRPLAILIAELQQAVLAEGNRLRLSVDAQPGVGTSSAAQPAGPPLISGAAISAEQPATARTAAQYAYPDVALSCCSSTPHPFLCAL